MELRDGKYLYCSLNHLFRAIFLTCLVIGYYLTTKHTIHIIISYQTLFQYHTSKQKHKSIKHNMILRTWSKGQKGLRQSCPNKGYNNYTVDWMKLNWRRGIVEIWWASMSGVPGSKPGNSRFWVLIFYILTLLLVLCFCIVIVMLNYWDV